MTDELLRRLSEPEPYRSLRLQKERLDQEREEAARQMMFDLQAENLRREIKQMGETPCR